MKTPRLPLALAVSLLFLTALSISCRRAPVSLNGVWEGTLYLTEQKAGENDEVPIRVEFKQDGDQLTGALINGDEATPATSGSWDGKNLRLRFDYYDGELTAALIRRELIGEFTRQWQKQTLRRPVKLWRSAQDFTPPDNSGKNIGGDWTLKVGEGDKQRIWRAQFRQEQSKVTGTLIPLSGDWGAMSGKFYDGRLMLARFDGINAHTFKAVLRDDGTLEGAVDFGLPASRQRKVIGERVTAQAGAPAMPDPYGVTRVKNATEPFRFSFPDADGKTVSATDARFKNKVVVLTIGGSWCPNCHDEATVLGDLYERYRARGLEIIGLSFEYTGDAKRDIEQVRAFVRRHNVKFPVLLAGSTEDGEVERKLPQLTGFSAFPTAIYLGRDGRVRRIHAGFEGPATGDRHTKLKAEMDELIRELLAENEGS
ncbi:MAG: peroxiredoxin family protein [Blastocatellia bacterium]